MATTQVSTSVLKDGSVTSAKLDTNIAISGNLIVDTNTLYVDSTNNRVGIGTTSPDAKLDVESTVDYQIMAKYNATNYTEYGYFGLNVVGSSNPYVFKMQGTERMRIDSSGVVRVGTILAQSNATFSARRNGANIEFGHSNNSGGYYGTLGAWGSNGSSYIGFSCDNDDTLNTFTTRGSKGNIITGDVNGHLIFSQVTNANASGQTPTERMRINSGGDISFRDTSANEAFYWDASTARLGIGTGSSPSEKLEVKDGSIRTTTLNSFSNLISGRASVPNASGYNIGGLLFQAYRTGTTYTTGAAIYSYSDGGAWTSTSVPSYLSFQTAAVGTTNTTERMHITSAGNVGIGTDSPATIIHAADPNGAILRLERKDNNVLDGDLLGGIETYRDDDDGAYIQTFIKSYATETYGRQGYMTFGTNNNNNGDAEERMRITSGGNVGIGTPSPSNSVSGLHIAVNQSTDQLYLERTGSGSGKWWLGTASNSLYFYDTVANTTRMIINSSGNVGIGTDSPRADAFTVGLTIGNTTTGAAQLVLEENTLAGGWRILSNGFLGFYANNDERMRITSGGDVLFGGISSTPSSSVYGSAFIVGGSGLRQLFQSTSTTTAVSVQRFYNPNGNVGAIALSGFSTSYNETSDYRLKENVVPITGALDRVDALKPSRFNFIADADTTVDGFLAHELAEVVPEAVTGEKDAVDEEGNAIYQGIDKGKIVPLLVGAIQELKAEIETLKLQINN